MTEKMRKQSSVVVSREVNPMPLLFIILLVRRKITHYCNYKCCSLQYYYHQVLPVVGIPTHEREERGGRQKEVGGAALLGERKEAIVYCYLTGQQ